MHGRLIRDRPLQERAFARRIGLHLEWRRKPRSHSGRERCRLRFRWRLELMARLRTLAENAPDAEAQMILAIGERNIELDLEEPRRLRIGNANQKVAAADFHRFTRTG